MNQEETIDLIDDILSIVDFPLCFLELSENIQEQLLKAVKDYETNNTSTD
jgi:hypothetical protein